MRPHSYPTNLSSYLVTIGSRSGNNYISAFVELIAYIYNINRRMNAQTATFVHGYFPKLTAIYSTFNTTLFYLVKQETCLLQPRIQPPCWLKLHLHHILWQLWFNRYQFISVNIYNTLCMIHRYIQMNWSVTNNNAKIVRNAHSFTIPWIIRNQYAFRYCTEHIVAYNYHKTQYKSAGSIMWNQTSSARILSIVALIKVTGAAWQKDGSPCLYISFQ